MIANFEFEIMIKNFNEQTLFFTINTANMQWRNLYKHMSNFEQYQFVIEIARSKMIWRLLQKNFYIVAKYFDRQWQLFINLMFEHKFKMLNFWYRYEWQTQNNEHIYEFVWIKTFSIKQLQKYLKFWNLLMIVVNSKKIYHLLFCIYVINFSTIASTFNANLLNCSIKLNVISNAFLFIVNAKSKILKNCSANFIFQNHFKIFLSCLTF